MSYEAWGEPDDSPFDAAIDAGWIDPSDQSKALIDVMNERIRQQDDEGWTPEHDNRHTNGEMAGAAACYALASTSQPHGKVKLEAKHAIHECWPFERDWWKPSNPRRNLVKAGALILAEIERLDRMSEAKP